MIKKAAVLVLVLFCMQNFAQKTNSSPYSALGIGEENPERTVEELSMGGVGVSGSDIYNLNFNNPASFAALKLTTYAVAGQNTAYKFEDQSTTQKSSNAFLSYIAVGIPVGPKGGFAFGLHPKTSVGYSIEESMFDGGENLIEKAIYTGDGGVNRVFLGGGYEITKGLSIGIEAEYLFGDVENTIVHKKADVQFGTKYEAKSDLEGLAFEIGAIYKKELKKNLFLNFGAKIELESDLDIKGDEYLYSADIRELFEIPRDTLVDNELDGAYVTPLKTSLGVSMGKNNKWSAGIDYSFRSAIKLPENLEDFNSNLAYESANNISVGGYYIPRYNSISSYWDRVVYRWGFNLGNTGMLFDGTGNGTNFTTIDKVGTSFGVGLPVGAQTSRLNLGFEFGRRGTTDNNLVKEKYFNFRVGLTFGNKWFKPRKIN